LAFSQSGDFIIGLSFNQVFSDWEFSQSDDFTIQLLFWIGDLDAGATSREWRISGALTNDQSLILKVH
jgi:hypothetical protein